jgi:endonuclease YncB( thermonuclease family)
LEEEMPFTVIKGRFKPKAGIPDGDSVRFLADDLGLWRKLEGRPVKLGTGVKTKDTAQLRFEGIDAIEKGATKPLSTESRDSMLRLIGFDEDSDPEPRGCILTRMTDDKAGRPIGFVFAGDAEWNDGSEVWLDGATLRGSVNYRLAEAGYAYPLYYNTLFASLREEFDVAINHARQHGLGYWPHDKTITGVTVNGRADLATVDPIWPKLWRRLDEFLRDHPSLAGFVDFLEEKDERVDLLTIMEERGLQDFIEVNGNTVRLKGMPENLRVIAKAGGRCR